MKKFTIYKSVQRLGSEVNLGGHCFFAIGRILFFLCFLFSFNSSFSQTSVTYTNTTTWVAPSCITTVTVECWGGGGGGRAKYGVLAGGGGGGGAYSQKVITVTPGNTYSVNVGNGGGGAAAADASAGGASWFWNSSTLRANGGGGAANWTGGSGGAVSGTGTVEYAGGNGGDGGGSNGGGGGEAAGSSTFGDAGNNGNGGAGGSGNNTDGGDGGAGSGNNGANGTGPGGGGGGGGDDFGDNGGDGAVGQVKITYKEYVATLASANPASTTSTICTSTTFNEIYAFTIALDGGAGDRSFTAFDFTTTGTYQAADFSKFQLWYNTTNNLATASQLGSDLLPTAAGLQSFAGFSQTLSASATSYFWITADATASPTDGGTLVVSAITTSNITMACGTKTGTASSGSTHTILVPTAAAVGEAGGRNLVCNNEVFTLSGAAVGGSASTGAWSISNSSPPAGGSHTLSSTLQTATPDAVTFTPYGGYTGTVTLTLTTDGCAATDTRILEVINCGATTYTTSSSWKAPCGVTSVTVECWGGGGGASGNDGFNGGGGGGGGAYAKKVISVTPGTTYSINVGAGGGGVTNGNTAGNGSASWFWNSSTLRANGGSGANGQSGGNGGSVSGTGTTERAGGNGGNGGSSNGGGGGEAGGSTNTGDNGSNGNGGAGGSGNNSDGGDGGSGSGNDGSAGDAPGGGGGGGGDDSGDDGANGGSGRVIVTLPAAIAHPTASAGSDIHACYLSGAINITTGVSASNYSTAIWTKLNGTGALANATSTVSATYTPSTADVTTEKIKLLIGLISADGCDSGGDDKTFYVYSDTSWLGSTSSDWATGGNWCSGAPTCSDNIVIPSFALNQPAINSAGAECHNITIQPGAILTTGSSYSLSVCGNWNNNGTYTSNTGAIHFVGSSDQTIDGGGLTFYDLVINNTGSSGSDNVILNQPVTVSNQLTFTDGILVTDATNLLTLTNTSSNANNGGASGSFVSGPIRWNGLNGAGPFIFPTGKGTKWARVAVSGVTASTDFTCEYFNTSYSNVSSFDLSTSVTPVLSAVSSVEYWDVARTSGSGSAAVTLYWENASESGINSCAQNGSLKVAHYTSGKWENANTSGVISVAGSCSGTEFGAVQSDLMSSFSPFSFGTGGGGGTNPLPIELLTFDVVHNSNFVEVVWSTATEKNNGHYTVERSQDGINFMTVDMVSSKAPQGNSTTQLDYSYSDFDNLLPGTYYYRLKQTDMDGSYTYSGVKTVSIKSFVALHMTIAPNPTDGKYFSVISEMVEDEVVLISIHDILGKTVYEKTFVSERSGTEIFPVQLSEQLPPGVYLITATFTDGDIISKRMIVK